MATRPKRPVTLVQAVTEPKMHLKRKMLDEFADPARGHDLTLVAPNVWVMQASPTGDPRVTHG